MTNNRITDLQNLSPQSILKERFRRDLPELTNAERLKRWYEIRDSAQVVMEQALLRAGTATSSSETDNEIGDGVGHTSTKNQMSSPKDAAAQARADIEIAEKNIAAIKILIAADVDAAIRRDIDGSIITKFFGKIGLKTSQATVICEAIKNKNQVNA